MKAAFFSLLITLGMAARSHAADGQMEIHPLAPGVYIHTSYQRLNNGQWFPSNGLIVIDNRDAWIVDTPWPAADLTTLTDWIAARGLNLKGSVSTHFHDDRTSGIAQLNQMGIPTYASAATNALLLEQGDEPALNAFSDAEFAMVPGVIKVFFPGPGHAPDNVVVWLPRSRILFGGCLVRSADTRSLGNTADGSIDDWGQSVARIQERYAELRHVIPGHGAAGGVELLDHTRALVARHQEQEN